MKQRDIKKFLLEWLGLVVVSVGLYWLLWLVIGKLDYSQEESVWSVLVLDFGYCAVLSLCAMSVCGGAVRLFSRWMARRWAFLAASVGSLVVNILLAHLLEFAINRLIGMQVSDPEAIEGIYVCILIVTMLSIVLLAESHWQLLAAEHRERRQSEQMVLKQRLDIEQLQRIVDDFRAKENSTNNEQEKQTEPQTLDVQSLLTQLGITQRQYRTRFLAPVIDGVTVIDVKDISHITIEGEKLMAYLNDGKSVRLEETSLDIVESLLDPADFFRANRQYIVNIRSIARLSNFFNQTKLLHLKGFPDLEIKISKDKYSQLREWVNG